MTRAEMTALGWTDLDVLIVTGDAYVDHPAFGAALIGRWLAAHGYRVGLVAQPRWDDPSDVARLGRPRLFAGVTAGALDSLLAHYTAFRKKRRDDPYSPGGRAGLRPNRATLVYANLVRQAFPGLPILLGGIEASLRRLTHYDFWSDGPRRSILLDGKADLVVYGMAELAVLAAAERLKEARPKPGVPEPGFWAGISGTAFAGRETDIPSGAVVVILPSHEDISADPAKLVTATLALERHVHEGSHWAVQPSGNRLVILPPPARPLTQAEMDRLYALPFARGPHPSYREPIPAARMMAGSITTHRGCGGGCTFCSLALHQGRRITSRSRASIVQEVAALAGRNDFDGSLSDVGGPSANMWGAVCTRTDGRCRRTSCLYPALCPRLRVDQTAILGLLEALQDLPGVKHVRVASGVRFDLALKDLEYLNGLAADFVGGQLKIAPEHVSPGVLKLMRKPGREIFEEFLKRFEAASRRAGRRQYVVPYLISAFPGCTEKEMKELADWLEARNWRPRQVQCFIPTPGTLATAMYFAGVDTQGRPIPVARTDAVRLRQHGLLAPQTAKTKKRDRSGRRADRKD
ncbi:MAG: YgiQ family radical SAM protein [Thermodesulfobacteriota bacterium]